MASEKLLNTAYYSRNGDQNYSEAPPHTSQNGHHQKSANSKGWKDVERMEPSSSVGAAVNWCSHHGEQYGGSSTREKEKCSLTQQSHFWAHSMRKPQLRKTHIPQFHCSAIYNSQDVEAT